MIICIASRDLEIHLLRTPLSVSLPAVSTWIRLICIFYPYKREARVLCVSLKSHWSWNERQKKTICSKIRWRDPSVFFSLFLNGTTPFSYTWCVSVGPHYFLVNVTISWLFGNKLCCFELVHTFYDFEYVSCSIHWLIADVNHKLILLHLHRHRRSSTSLLFRMNISFSSAYSTGGIYERIGITHRRTFLVFVFLCTNKIDRNKVTKDFISKIATSTIEFIIIDIDLNWICALRWECYLVYVLIYWQERRQHE